VGEEEEVEEHTQIAIGVLAPAILVSSILNCSVGFYFSTFF